jgi:hypothetical protein
MNKVLVSAVLIIVAILGDRAWCAEILSPAEGTVVVPGSLITVKIGPSPGEEISEAALVTSEGMVTAVPSTLPGTFEAAVRVPVAAVGPEIVTAYATLIGRGASVAQVTLLAQPGVLERLFLSAPPILTFIGEVAQVEVKGRFTDAVTRDLTLPEAGTTYASSDQNVLGVLPNGLIQARTRGVAQIMVTNRGKTAIGTTRVAVASPPDNRIPIPNAGPDQNVASETLVDLSGAASADPDSDPMQYRWEQESGPMVLLRDANTATPYFISPRVDGESVLEFSLAVTDSKGAMSFPDTVRITVSP